MKINAAHLSGGKSLGTEKGGAKLRINTSRWPLSRAGYMSITGPDQCSFELARRTNII